MATNDVSYDKYTVQQGGGSNTLNLIATEKTKDINVLKKLNPNISDTEAPIDPGTNILIGVGSMTSSVDGFTIGTLHVGPYDYDEKKYKLTITFIDGTVKYDYVKGNPNNTTVPDISLQTIINNKTKWSSGDIDIATLINLNPWVSTQTALIPMGEIVLLEVCVPGSQVTPTITKCGIRVNSTRTCYIRWQWDHKANNTTGMEVKWNYQTSDGQWWVGTKTDVSDIETFENTYSPSDDAVAVSVSIRPKDKTTTSSLSAATTTTKYKWTTEQLISFADTWSVITPGSPSVEIKKYVLTATYEDLPVDIYKIKYVQFEVVQLGDTNTYSKYETSDKYSVDAYGYVRYTCNIAAGFKYRVRARCYSEVEGLEYCSSWSELSNPIDSLPIAPELYECNTLNNNVVQFNWKKVITAKNYEIQYLIKNNEEAKNYNNLTEYFNSKENNGVEKISLDASTDVTEVDGVIQYRTSIPNGDYLVRVRAANEGGVSIWLEEYIKEIVLGKLPDSPTTWSSTTTVSIGEPLTLYWIHNSKDNSVETKAEIKLIVDGVEQDPIYVVKPTEEDKKDETSHYIIDTNSYPNGCKIEWEVRTAGVYKNSDNPDGYGAWSINRTINIYATPHLTVNLLNNNRESLEENPYLRSLPFYIQMKISNVENQTPTGYHVSVISQDSYYTVDEVGNEKAIMAGSIIFSKYYDITDAEYEIELSAGDLTLENNQHYVVACSASMSSGLIAEKTTNPFRVAWVRQGYEPNARVTINKDKLTASINPFAGNAGLSVKLFVYRREFDGTFTEIISDSDGLDNTGSTWVTDPHPALDYARYRIVSKNIDSGITNYFDIPGIPVQEKSVVIQWDEKWQSFDETDEEKAMINFEDAYTGSILKLPYNIDVSNAHSPDVALVKYTGRKRPVSYYGTQRGESATWNMEIPKSDTETLYALRRLAIYMGDVYVREPSGSGYWASITVSFSQKHLGLTIPVTINITPVEGGM